MRRGIQFQPLATSLLIARKAIIRFLETAKHFFGDSGVWVNDFAEGFYCLFSHSDPMYNSESLVNPFF